METGLKLVLVDDQEDILETLEIKIPDVCDYEIEMFTFTNLQDATDFIFENPIHAVITDIHLGEELGIDIFEYCSYLNKGIQVIALSGDTSKETIEKCFNAGVEYFLNKPFQDEQIRESLDKVHNHFKYWRKIIDESL
ncbi:MAG: response regulator [Bdellovibrionota bacterium]|nr:response regulator [Bdellovibrionota bacterium]